MLDQSAELPDFFVDPNIVLKVGLRRPAKLEEMIVFELPGRVGRRYSTCVSYGSVLHVIEPTGAWRVTELASLEAAAGAV